MDRQPRRHAGMVHFQRQVCMPRPYSYNDDATKPRRADECPYWCFEHSNVWGISKGRSHSPNGASDIDGLDACCGSGFPTRSTPPEPLHNVQNEDRLRKLFDNRTNFNRKTKDTLALVFQDLAGEDFVDKSWVQNAFFAFAEEEQGTYITVLLFHQLLQP